MLYLYDFRSNDPPEIDSDLRRFDLRRDITAEILRKRRAQSLGAARDIADPAEQENVGEIQRMVWVPLEKVREKICVPPMITACFQQNPS
jgi:hypothetical protein